jgi:hypothetical protein
MKKALLLTCLVVFSYLQVNAQGCVAVRSTGGLCTMTSHLDSAAVPGSWVLATSSRYFKSFRHFRGREEQKERLELGTEVINHQFALDISLTRHLNQFWSFMVDVPLLYNSRSSLYEHGRAERGMMHSSGVGDMRVAAYRWLLNPGKHHKGNIQVGLGLKLPTGDYDYKDYWQNVGPNGTKELRTVDQSIQLGDGGTGISAELNAFYSVTPGLGVYGNFYYLANPREQNGVRTYRELVSPTLANEAIMSVPDQYMGRAGVNYSHRSLILSAGMRLEGIPVYDLIGGSGDFRRPGYIWSAEPGLTCQFKKVNLFATVPIALVRNRTQSVTDKENSIIRQTFVQGDAAFSDYTVNLGFSVRL